MIRTTIKVGVLISFIVLSLSGVVFAEEKITFKKYNDEMLSFEVPFDWGEFNHEEKQVFHHSYEKQRKEMFLRYNGNIEEFSKLEWDTTHVTGFFAPQRAVSLVAIVMNVKEAKMYVDQMEKDGEARIQMATSRRLIKKGEMSKDEFNGMQALVTDFDLNNGRKMLTYLFHSTENNSYVAVFHVSCNKTIYDSKALLFKHIMDTIMIRFPDLE
ncbi:MAG: hypothetical protein GY853_08905 [PVC group bacterium]|nr:hypothetical protein [PVC group bacterium]